MRLCVRTGWNRPVCLARNGHRLPGLVGGERDWEVVPEGARLLLGVNVQDGVMLKHSTACYVPAGMSGCGCTSVTCVKCRREEKRLPRFCSPGGRGGP